MPHHSSPSDTGGIAWRWTVTFTLTTLVVGAVIYTPFVLAMRRFYRPENRMFVDAYVIVVWAVVVAVSATLPMRQRSMQWLLCVVETIVAAAILRPTGPMFIAWLRRRT